MHLSRGLAGVAGGGAASSCLVTETLLQANSHGVANLTVGFFRGAFMPVLANDDIVAHLTDIAYQALLQHGLRRPFLDVELELWRRIRAALQAGVAIVPGQSA
jgi:hypothetical protein